MDKEEFNKVKTGDTLYIVSALSNGYYEAYALNKDLDNISFISNGVVFRDKYSRVFTTEEKAKQEIIRRLKDSIRTKVSSVRHLMVNLHTFDSTALDDKFLSSITNAITKEFDKLKSK